jgi:hypothetical protein
MDHHTSLDQQVNEGKENPGVKVETRGIYIVMSSLPHIALLRRFRRHRAAENVDTSPLHFSDPFRVSEIVSPIEVILILAMQRLLIDFLRF